MEEIDESFEYPEFNPAHKRTLDDIAAWVRNFNELPIYFLNGPAEKGKTLVVKTIIRELRRSKQLTVSFFCSRTYDSNMIPALAIQLAEKVPRFRSNLVRVLQPNQPIRFPGQNIVAQMGEFIFNPLRESGIKNMVIVIDGLDKYEGEGNQAILSCLKTVESEIGEANMKFLITSRPMPEIQATFPDCMHSLTF